MAVIEQRKSQNGVSSYRVKIRLKGFLPVSQTFERKTDAKRWAQKTEAAMLEGKYFPEKIGQLKTLSDLSSLYLADLKMKNPARYTDAERLLRWWTDTYGQIALSAFNSEYVLKGQQKLKAKTKARRDQTTGPSLSNSTVNRYTVALSTALNFGVRRLKWLKHNPVADVGKFSEPLGRTRFLDKQEIDRLLSACRESQNLQLFTIVLIAISTGARKAEISRMRWEDISLDGSQITLWKTKNGEIRTACLEGPIFRLIQKTREGKKGLLFPSTENPSRPVDFRHAWECALKRAEITNFHFHDLRHTCASYLAMNNANAVEIAHILGHKTLEMVKRYAHLSPQHVSKLSQKMAEGVLGHVEV